MKAIDEEEKKSLEEAKNNEAVELTAKSSSEDAKDSPQNIDDGENSPAPEKWVKEMFLH